MPTPTPTVHTTAGPVRGTTEHDTFVFSGIPYGASTAGDRRFRAPFPPTPRTDVRDATEYGHTTVQHRPLVDPYVSARTGRSCLPAHAHERRLPARQRLHARPGRWQTAPRHGLAPRRGFRTGVGATRAADGVRLTERGDVVVVSINHRLNVYGYLHLLDPCGPDFNGSGQAGLLDIVLALQWVHDNIEAFGGDPGNVTLFGVPGGGRKISQLLGMPEARGLFHRGIIQSGAHPRCVPRERANDFAERFLARLGIKPSEISRLQHMPIEQLHAGLYGWLAEERDRESGFGGGLLSPTIDGVHIPAHPFDPVAAPSARGVPIIIGTTRHEMGTFLARNPEWANLDEADLIEATRPVLKDCTEEVIAITRENRPGSTPYDILAAFASEDRRQLSLQIAERHAAAGNPVYFYQFAWETDYANGLVRAGHGVDTPLVIDNPHGRPTTATAPGRDEIAALMSDTWIAFARTGDPNHEGLPEWQTFNADTRHQMVLDLPPHAESDVDRTERLAWRDINVHLPFEGPAFVGAFAD